MALMRGKCCNGPKPVQAPLIPPDPLPSAIRSRVAALNHQQMQEHRRAASSPRRDWEAHGKQRGTKKPAKAGRVGCHRPAGQTLLARGAYLNQRPGATVLRSIEV